VRFGIVRGVVVLSLSDPGLKGTRLLVVEPVTAENLHEDSPSGGGKQLIVADQLGPGEGQMIAFVEGREAANPYWPGRAPVDAYCSLIVDTIDFRPPAQVEEPVESSLKAEAMACIK
jgi:carbon dioxide concentrating mechanism protein CcmL